MTDTHVTVTDDGILIPLTPDQVARLRYLHDVAKEWTDDDRLVMTVYNGCVARGNVMHQVLLER